MTALEKLRGMRRNTSEESDSSSSQSSKQTVVPKQVAMTPGVRMQTGITGFDRMTNGGFKQSTVNVVSGGPGTGKTIFALQFLVNGILKFGQPGVFITFDETTQSIIENAKSVGFDLQAHIDSKQLLIVEYTPQQLMKILTDGGGLLDNLMSKYHAQRLVIDSVSTLLMMNSSEFGKRELLLNFFKLLKKWNVTALLTNEYTPVTGNDIGRDIFALSFETDSITQLYFIHDKIGQERKRYLEVYKMRGTGHVVGAVPYVIGNGGFSL